MSYKLLHEEMSGSDMDLGVVHILYNASGVGG